MDRKNEPANFKSADDEMFAFLSSLGDRWQVSESESEFAAFKKAFALELYLRHIEKFSPRIGRKIARVRVRKMQTRWGSCNHAKGYLNFSLSLIERDRRFVEYVVLHELAHLVHANHGADFYALIAQIMPDFRARIKLGKG